jgi:hypothetical protein
LRRIAAPAPPCRIPRSRSGGADLLIGSVLPLEG